MVLWFITEFFLYTRKKIKIQLLSLHPVPETAPAYLTA